MHQKLKNLRSEIWDNGLISEWVSRSDTECLVYTSGPYIMFIWGRKGRSYEAEAQRCFRILEFLGVPPGFTVHWWAIPADRITEAGKFPTRAEVNGGWAYRARPAIWVFREEEWDRVVIHECVHALDWDVHPSEQTIRCMEQTLQGDITDALFEAATELNAEWLWCVIHSPDDDDEGRTWIAQCRWMMSQAAAIILRQGERPWEEDTSVFAYYVLKAALALEMENFMIGWLSGTLDTEEWCDYWRSHQKAFYHNAQKDRRSLASAISTRMTNPILEKSSPTKD